MGLDEKFGSIEINGFGKCCICGKDTPFYDREVVEYVCSDECIKELTESYEVRVNSTFEKISMLIDNVCERRKNHIKLVRSYIKFLGECAMVLPKEIAYSIRAWKIKKRK